MTVEIDETFLFRRKYNIGRTLFNERESIWILGGVCRENKEAFAVHVPDRGAETLERLILRHVAQDTRIITDGWRGYVNLQKLGFNHATVIHNDHFVDPNDRTVHTNTIERRWGILKQIIPWQCHGEFRFEYLAEYI